MIEGGVIDPYSPIARKPMPYFVFFLNKGTNGIIRDAQLLNQFDDYKQAKQFARNKRAQDDVKQASDIKIMFADNIDHAEHRLLENRDAPVLREWEI